MFVFHYDGPNVVVLACCSSTVYHYHTLTTYVVVGIGICTTSYFKSAVGRHFTLECCPIFQLTFFYISNFDNWIRQKLTLFNKFSFALGSQYLQLVQQALLSALLYWFKLLKTTWLRSYYILVAH